MVKIPAEELQKLIHKRDFTSEEVISFTKIDPLTFRNWLKRGVVEIGEKHRLGRWLFSPIDMVKISAMVDLNQFGVTPAAAASLCNMVAELLERFVEDPISWRAGPEYDDYSALPYPIGDYVVVAFPDDGGFTKACAVWIDNELIFDRNDKVNNEAGQAMRRVTHIQIAAGLIIEDIMEKVKHALDKRKDEGV